MNRFIHLMPKPLWASQVALVVKNSSASAGDIRGSIPGSGRSPGEGNGTPLQHSCLENPMDRGAWQATVHRVAKRWTRLKRLRMHAKPPQHEQILTAKTEACEAHSRPGKMTLVLTLAASSRCKGNNIKFTAGEMYN